MQDDTRKAYDALIDHVRRANLLGSTGSLLGWDQEVMMPTGGGAVEYRGRQLAQLAAMSHEMETDPQVGEWLAACEADGALTADPTAPEAVNVREIRRDYDRATKLPAELVERFTQTASQAQHAWQQARRGNDFEQFRPWLEELIELNRRKAECWGWPKDGEAWDALAEGFEPGMTAAGMAELFEPLRNELAGLIRELSERGSAPDDRFARIKLPIEAQRRFVRDVVDRIGFDFSRGRLDEAAHPFCGGTHRDDVRMTTRFHEAMVHDALGSTMHEAGHGLYDQNLPGGEHLNTPMGEPVGLSIHESQSRLIENHVGRSHAFWRWCHPKLAEHFGSAVDGIGLDEAYAACNLVQPSLIRVEADEATYHMHIMIRFDLERAMIRGDLSAADLPGEWNKAYKKYLGIDVPDDARGCLQDIHWSFGAIGYFPTYTLGSLYAAQFFEQARNDISDLDAKIEHGEFAPLVSWLNDRIHSQGMRYRSEALCEHVTGRPLSTGPMLNHLRAKLKPLYGV